jgi:hypothetical protein
MHTSTDEVRVAKDGSSLGVSSLIPTEDKSRQPKIDVQRSWAASNGQTYRLVTRRNAYVDSLKEPTPWTFEWVDLVAVKDGREVKASWSNGEWELHLEYTNAQLRPPIDAKFRLWTFWYIPLIHGSPN